MARYYGFLYEVGPAEYRDCQMRQGRQAFQRISPLVLKAQWQPLEPPAYC